MRVRIPKQKRSRERKERIMEVARDVFASKGLNGTSSNEIARNAGMSIGTFYSYFENKRSLFLEILEGHLKTFVTDIYTLRNDASIDLRENIREHIEKTFKVFDRHPAFHKEALVLKFSDPDVKRLFDEVEQEQIAIISFLVKPYCREKGPERLSEISKMVHSTVESIAHSVKFLGSPLNGDRLMEELIDMIYHYVNNL